MPTCRPALISWLGAKDVPSIRPQAVSLPSGLSRAVVPLAPRNSECLRLSALAELDLDDIIDRFDLLAEQPGMGRARPEFGPGVRSFAVENFVITIVKKTMF